ncbi:MAG: glycosyl hydrolase family 65 protein [Acidimicrobiia bacterium]
MQPHEADELLLEYTSYDPAEEPLREALCTIGNGRFATRGAAPECAADEEVHYPGTYVAGIYNRLTDHKAGREIENESLVNLPNWLPLTFRIEDGPWFSIDEVEITSFRQALEVDRGVLVREVGFVDPEGRHTTLTQRRLVSMARSEVAALETNLRAKDWSGRLTIRSRIDAGVRNRNVARYRDLADRHLDVLDVCRDPSGHLAVRVRTNQSRIEVVVGARHRVWVDDEPVSIERRAVDTAEAAGEELVLDVAEGARVRVEKVAAIVTSRDTAISEPALTVRELLREAPDFSELEIEHRDAWIGLWRRFRVDLEAPSRIRKVTNLHLFHVMTVACPNVFDVDAGIPARGLHGEAYRGHIFWDEMFVMPLLVSRAPEVAAAFIRYRYRRLPAARRAAGKHGYRGAMFPWQSGSDGREETQEVHLNPKSGHWLPDRSHRQRHVNIAIVYNVIQYLRYTDDLEFLTEFGAELLVEIGLFWSSITTYDRLADRFEITGVMGPDEFHDDDPNWDGEGLRNNAYTNVMVAWLLDAIPRVVDRLPSHQRQTVETRTGFDQGERARWREISHKLYVPTHADGVISQFEGYEALEEFDWLGYEERYGDIQRLDRILESEGDTVNRYKASKQADVLMLFYLLSFEELQTVFDRLGVPFDEEVLDRTIDYYLDRTSHGSTLSQLVHSWVFARANREQSMPLLRKALEADVSDVQGGTTQEGIHLGAMAGTVDMIVRGYSGMEAGADGVLRFKPNVDEEMERIAFRVYFRRRWIHVELWDQMMRLTSEVTGKRPVLVECKGARAELPSGGEVLFERTNGAAAVVG